LIACTFEGGLALAAVGLAWLYGRGVFLRVAWNAETIVWGLIAVVPMLAAFLGTVHLNVAPLRRLRQVIECVLVPFLGRCSLVDLALISLTAGIGEELLFRDVIQAAYTDWLGVGWGIVIASILFGAAHAITPTYAVLAGLFGGYLGWLYFATGNLLTPIITHAAYDFLALAYLLRLRTPRDVPADLDGPAFERLSPGE
jgi:membrane protease YdiL (CAAX protease family)